MTENHAQHFKNIKDETAKAYLLSINWLGAYVKNIFINNWQWREYMEQCKGNLRQYVTNDEICNMALRNREFRAIILESIVDKTLYSNISASR